MKTIHLILISLLFATAWTGCKEDETFPAPAEGLKALPGLNRARVEFTVPADAESYKVFYSNGQFVQKQVSGDTQTVIVDELAEGEQILRVVTLNGAGEVSDPKGVKVNIYGSNYLASLSARKYVEQTILSENSVEIMFEEALAKETGVWVVFSNTAGKLDSLQMANTGTSIRIDNIDLDEPYYYYSLYKPVPESIDEFPSSKIDAKNAAMFIFNKEDWTIAGCSDEEPGGGDWGIAVNAIDDNANTFWHSKVNGGVEPMPHWIAVDMGGEKKMDGFYFVQTQEPSEQGLARHFDFAVSADGDEWEDVLSGEFANSRIRQEFAFTSRQSARYFKITINSGYNDVAWSQFAEIDLYNELNVSGVNGAVPIDALTNTRKPFATENPHIWGDGRIQKLVGWTHNAAATCSWDQAIGGGSIALFAVGGSEGVDYTTNAKVYQTVELEAGDYIMMYDCGNYDWGAGVLAYGVIATGATLPDITSVESSSLAYVELTATGNSPNKVNLLPFSLTAKATVSIGWVYNTFSNGNWTAFYMNEVGLLQNQ